MYVRTYDDALAAARAHWMQLKAGSIGHIHNGWMRDIDIAFFEPDQLPDDSVRPPHLKRDGR